VPYVALAQSSIPAMASSFFDRAVAQ